MAPNWVTVVLALILTVVQWVPVLVQSTGPSSSKLVLEPLNR